MSKTIDRKFMTWHVSTQDKRSYEVEVRYKQQNDRTDSPCTFYVNHKNPHFTVEDSDLEKLRHKLNETLDAFNKIDWKPMLMITVGETGVPIMRGRINADMPKVMDGGVAMHVGEFETGVAADGQKFWRVRSRHFGREDASGRKWSISRGEPWTKEKDETLGQIANQYALVIVEDTPKVRARLAEAADCLSELRKRMSEFANSGDFVARLLKGVSIPVLMLTE